MKYSTEELVAFLRSQNTVNARAIDKLKIVYRPYICPFDDLLEILPENASVFDIGCGNGMFLSLVANFKNPKLLGGIEISSELIANARQLLNETKKDVPLFLSTYNG